LAVERKAKLDEIGFELSVQDEANEETWNLQFKKLQDYYGKHGHCELLLAVGRSTFILKTPTNTTFLSSCIVGKVTQRYSLDPQLGRWVDTQRRRFKNGRMDVEREAKLDELGFKFSVRDKAK
jgi:hypothetical protein